MTNQNGAYAPTGSACLNKPELAFRDVLQATFGMLDWLPEADGTIHRFHVPGDRTGSLNGWYVLYAGNVAAGCFGSWRTGGSHSWSSREPANQAEAQQIRQHMEQARRQREAEQHQRQQAAADKAAQLWGKAVPANPNHPYLKAKGCQPHNLRQLGGVLLVPLYLGQALANLQRIYSDGSKRFLHGGRVKGCYSPIGHTTVDQPLYVCEGWATGATIHENNGAAVACAMNAGNLIEVGRALKNEQPHRPLIIAGDDDRQTQGNPGRTAATQAAALLSCGLVFPPWSGSEPLSLSDFNDLRQWREANQ